MFVSYVMFAIKHRGVRPLVLCILLLFLSPLLSRGQQVHVGLVQAFSKAYAHKDAEQLKDLLSPEFVVGIYDRKQEDFLLRTLTNNFPCDSIQHIEDIGRDRTKVLFHKKDKTKQEGLFHYDNNGLLKYVDVFDALYQVFRDQKATLVKTIPFEEKNGSIILHCRINDSNRELRLLFDTGADGMAVSTALGEELGLKITRTNSASVVGGNVEIQVSDDNTVHIGDFTFPNQGIALFCDYHKDTDGIIGNTLLKQYIVRVDYDNQLLELYTMGKYDFGKDGVVLPLELGSNLHIPVALQMNGGKEYNGQLYFDTGASYNLILFRPFVLKNRLLVDGFKPLSNASTVSMGVSSPTYVGMAESMHIGKQLHTDHFLLSLMAGNGQNQNWQPDADGSLGVGIIGRYNFTINLLEKQVHFNPNSRYHLQPDFVLGDYVFHFDLNKELHIGKIHDPAGLHNKIITINGKDMGEWVKKKDLQQQLTDLLKKTDLKIEVEQTGEIKTFTLKKG